MLDDDREMPENFLGKYIFNVEFYTIQSSKEFRHKNSVI